MAINQCSNFIKGHAITAHNTDHEGTPLDTAGAAPYILSLETKSAAGIMPAHAADIYDMHIIKQGIQDKDDNFTRFMLMERGSAQLSSEPAEIYCFYADGEVVGEVFLKLPCGDGFYYEAPFLPENANLCGQYNKHVLKDALIKARNVDAYKESES